MKHSSRYRVGHFPTITLVSIAVTPANSTVNTGSTLQFTAIGTYSDASTANITGTVTWASSVPANVTIAAGGLATGVAAGATNISATLGAISGSTGLTDVTPFTIASLPLSLLFAQGGFDGVSVWSGTASLGNSGNVDGAGVCGAGPALDGFATTQPTVGQSMAAVQKLNHPTHIQLASIIDINNTSMWALVFVTAIAGGAGTGADSAVMGGSAPRQAMLLGGVANNKYEAQVYFSQIASQTVPLNQWVLLQYRYTWNGAAGTVEARINGGAWSAPTAIGSAYFVDPTDYFTVGANVLGNAASVRFAHGAVSQTFFATSVFDNVRAALNATFPSINV